jgi:alpha-D-ribose 1-methylphosphonate 5-triphosphate diphosphatase
MNEAIFTNARLVLPDEVVTGAVAIRDGRIADIGSTSEAGEDFGGDLLLPGLIELHTDHVENHFAPRPGVTWNPLAAVQAHDVQIAGSGITTVFDALRVGMDGDERASLEGMLSLAEAIAKGRREDRLRVDHRIHLRCEISSPEVMPGFEAFIENVPLGIVSVMDHAPGQRQFAKMEVYRRYYQGTTGMSDEAFERFAAKRIAEAEANSAKNRQAIFDACRQKGIVVASHDDANVDHVMEAIDGGVAIAEFPTTKEAAAAAHTAGLKVLMGAPNRVRGGSHSGNVSTQELAEDGSLDILSSDYVPASLLMAALLLPSLVPSISLPDAVATVTSNSASAVGLDDRGAIAVGLRADLIRVRAGEGPPVVVAAWREGRRIV